MTSPTAGLSYADAVAALTERGRFGISLGLTRVERLMAETGHPERGLRGALVGGTNGKGSVVALVRAALNAAGYRIGTMPKPHLVSYRERIAVDGEPISPADFAAAVARVLPAIDRVAADIGPPTEFEALTAAAIGELARRRVDLAVVEVGMGGRLDATNVLDLGVAAITNVQRDHEQHLGRTLTAIGREKAAIVKPGNLAVTGASGSGLRPILDRCAAVGAPLRRVGPRQAYRGRLIGSDWDGIVVDLRTPKRRLRDLRVGLLGAHQAENAAVAVAVLDAIAERWSVDVPDEAVRRGFAEARWPGRLELLDGRRVGHDRVLLDGAHNPAGADTCASVFFGDFVPEGRRILVVGTLREPSAMLEALRADEFDVVIACTAPSPRAADAGAIAKAALDLGCDEVFAHDTVDAACAHALRLADADDAVLAAGSLYVAGAARSSLLRLSP